jgi:elongation of very long chain fatty acids protein 6
VYVFYCYSQFASTCRWFMNMNYFVHALMYTYFALRALRVRVPKAIAMAITSLQLVQMVVGCTIISLAFQFKQNGESIVE